MNRGTGLASRLQNANTEQTIKSSAGILHRVVLSNSSTAGTLTIKDGSTTLIVLNVPASTAAPVAIEFGIAFSSSLKMTPSATSIDALVVYV